MNAVGVVRRSREEAGFLQRGLLPSFTDWRAVCQLAVAAGPWVITTREGELAEEFTRFERPRPARSVAALDQIKYMLNFVVSLQSLLS